MWIDLEIIHGRTFTPTTVELRRVFVIAVDDDGALFHLSCNSIVGVVVVVVVIVIVIVTIIVIEIDVKQSATIQ